jgi:hypothetical protein
MREDVIVDFIMYKMDVIEINACARSRAYVTFFSARAPFPLRPGPITKLENCNNILYNLNFMC